MLYIAYGVGGFVLFLVLCGCAGIMIYFLVSSKNAESRRRNSQRASIESSSSNV